MAGVDDNTISRDVPDAGKAQAPQARPEAMHSEKSWGEKYKTQTFSFIRNKFINYFVNFIIGASTTYAFDTYDSKYTGKGFREIVNRVTEGTKNQKAWQFLFKFCTRTQLLLCGGHVILPLVRWMHNNQKRLEFGIGHKLDQLQTILGRGNTASQLSLEEYNRVSELLARKQDAASLSDQDKALLAKNSIDDHLKFKEHWQSWGKAIKARLTGVGVTTSMSVGLALASNLPDRAPWKYGRFEEVIEEPVGKFIGDKFISRIPLISSIFGKKEVLKDTVKAGKQALSGHQLIGKYYIDDMIFTAGSKFGFDKMEAHHQRKEEAEKATLAIVAANEAEAAATRAEKAADKIERIEKKEWAGRKTILAKGQPQSFRAQEALREENRNEEAYQVV